MTVNLQPSTPNPYLTLSAGGERDRQPDPGPTGRRSSDLSAYRDCAGFGQAITRPGYPRRDDVPELEAVRAERDPITARLRRELVVDDGRDPACPDCERTHPWRDHSMTESELRAWWGDR